LAAGHSTPGPVLPPGHHRSTTWRSSRKRRQSPVPVSGPPSVGDRWEGPGFPAAQVRPRRGTAKGCSTPPHRFGKDPGVTPRTAAGPRGAPCPRSAHHPAGRRLPAAVSTAAVRTPRSERTPPHEE
jgi:hypothetical protein